MRAISGVTTPPGFEPWKPGDYGKALTLPDAQYVWKTDNQVGLITLR